MKIIFPPTLLGPPALILVSLSTKATAQVIHNNINSVYSQNFNSMPSNGNTLSFVSNSTITGWYVSRMVLTH